MYEYTDARLKGLIRRTQRLFGELKAMPFDELNVMQRVSEVYRKAEKQAWQCYCDIIEYYYLFGYDRYVELPKEDGKKEKKSVRDKLIAEADKKTERKADKLLDEILDEYDPVTKYQFTKEAERKKQRLIEAVLASQQTTEIPKTARKAARKSAKKATSAAVEIDKALKYWVLQVSEYATKATDRAMLEGYEDAGAEYVRWMAQSDERVCMVCKEREGQIYRIDSVPNKPHYNCRCWWEVVFRA